MLMLRYYRRQLWGQEEMIHLLYPCHHLFLTIKTIILLLDKLSTARLLFKKEMRTHSGFFLPDLITIPLALSFKIKDI
jgi:hypothetical protein